MAHDGDIGVDSNATSGTVVFTVRLPRRREHLAISVEPNVHFHTEVSCCKDRAISTKLEEARHGVFRLRTKFVQTGAVKALTAMGR